MRSRAPRAANQAGETLIELLMAMSILGTAVVALVGGIGTSIVMSDIHRKQATAGAVVRTYAEAIQSGVTTSTKPYVDCANVSAYASPAGFTQVGGYTATVVAVTYWSGTAFATTCSSDEGVQKLALRVSSADAKAVETLELIIRDPS